MIERLVTLTRISWRRNVGTRLIHWSSSWPPCQKIYHSVQYQICSVSTGKKNASSMNGHQSNGSSMNGSNGGGDYGTPGSAKVSLQHRDILNLQQSTSRDIEFSQIGRTPFLLFCSLHHQAQKSRNRNVSPSAAPSFYATFEEQGVNIAHCSLLS